MPDEPYCPNCAATDKQSRLTVAAFSKLKAHLRGEAAAHFDTAHRCGICGAHYSFRAGKSFAIGGTSKLSSHQR